MTATSGQRLQSALYAVLDPARDPSIWGAISRLAPDANCLFSGVLSDELRQASPHLTPLLPDGELMSLWREQGAGKSWGVAFSSAAGVDALRRHLKKFTFAYLPDDRRVLFRFWDPRVLTAYLPHCTEEGREAFFGPMTAIYAEDWKTGRSVTLTPTEPPSTQARPSRFVQLTDAQVSQLNCTSFVLETYELLTSRSVSVDFRASLRAHRVDVLAFWERLWPRLHGMSADIVSPALAYAAVLRLRREDVYAGLDDVLRQSDPAYAMKTSLTAWGYLPFTAFNDWESS